MEIKIEVIEEATAFKGLVIPMEDESEQASFTPEEQAEVDQE